MKALRVMLLVSGLCTALPAFAVQPDEILPDPALESRARELSRQLRCMVCQNQSIDDSDAPLARDLRLLVRERLSAGDSDRQVLEFLTARYGDFVLLNPRFSARTALLWLTPMAVFGAGAVAAIIFLRRQRGGRGGEGDPGREAALSTQERARLDDLLKPGP